MDTDKTPAANRLDEMLAKVRSKKMVERPRIPGVSLRRTIREAAGLTQGDVAELLGYSRASVVIWEQSCTVEPEGEVRIKYRDLLYRLLIEVLAAEKARFEQAAGVIAESPFMRTNSATATKS